MDTPPRQGAAGAGPTAASVHDPRSLWAALAGALRSTLRWPRPAVPVRAAADDLLGQRRLPRRPQPLLGRQGQPCDRPASTIAGLQGGAWQRQRGVQEEGRVKARLMDQHWTEGRRTRPRLGASQVTQNAAWSPREVRPLGSCQVSRRSGGGAARVRPFVRARQGAHQHAADGLPPLPLLGREGSPSRREVDGRADDIALQPASWSCRRGNPRSQTSAASPLAARGPAGGGGLSVGCARTQSPHPGRAGRALPAAAS